MLDETEILWGIKPKIYTSYHMWVYLTTSPSWINDYELWVAHYTTTPPPLLPPHSTNWVFWQWTSTYIIDGTGYDANWFNGNEEQFTEYLEPIEEPEIVQPDDIEVELPGDLDMTTLLPKWIDNPIVLQTFTTATGRGQQVITLGNMPDGVKGVICRLAVRGDDLTSWVALGGHNYGNARFRLDGRVHSQVSFDLKTGMIPIEDNRLYVNYDGHDTGVTYYIEIHGYGYEPEYPDIEELKLAIDDLYADVAKLNDEISGINDTLDKTVKDGETVKITK